MSFLPSVTVGLMSYRKLLAEGEEVVVDVRPHWWYLAGPVATLAVMIAGAVAALVEGAPGWVDWITVVLLVAAVLWMVGRYIRWVTTRLILTTTRIIERRGILARTGREIPVSAVTNIGYRQTIFQRIIGAGDVTMESAGRDSEEVFPDLPRPAALQNEIYAQMEVQRLARSQGNPSSSRPASIPEQIDQLDQLRRRGVITDQEFEAKKTDLLNRL